MLDPNRVSHFINHAIEATLYVTPRDPGLSLAELIEVGKAHDFRQGEIRDAVANWIPDDRERFKIEGSPGQLLTLSTSPEDPRKPGTIQFVFDEFRNLAREFGAKDARIERDILIRRCADAGHSEQDAEIAVAVCIASAMVRLLPNGVLEQCNILKYADPKQMRAADSLRRQTTPAATYLAAVRDVIARREGRLATAREPRDAFEGELDALGAGTLKTWWSQTRDELSRASPLTSPVTVLVLTSALAEGALAIYAKAVQAQDPAAAPQGSARGWGLSQLVKWARGKPLALDQRLADRADDLSKHRWRIHIGRYLDDPAEVPLTDMRPEDARAATETLDQLLRALMHARR